MLRVYVESWCKEARVSQMTQLDQIVLQGLIIVIFTTSDGIMLKELKYGSSMQTMKTDSIKLSLTQ